MNQLKMVYRSFPAVIIRPKFYFHILGRLFYSAACTRVYSFGACTFPPRLHPVTVRIAKKTRNDNTREYFDLLIQYTSTFSNNTNCLSLFISILCKMWNIYQSLFYGHSLNFIGYCPWTSHFDKLLYIDNNFDKYEYNPFISRFL